MCGLLITHIVISAHQREIPLDSLAKNLNLQEFCKKSQLNVSSQTSDANIQAPVGQQRKATNNTILASLPTLPGGCMTVISHIIGHRESFILL